MTRRIALILWLAPLSSAALGRSVTSSTVPAGGASTSESKTTPPFVEFMTPGYFFPNVVDMSSVKIEFSIPVAGVRAKDLTVNGSAATRLTGKGKGPYVFTGYKAPKPGTVKVVLEQGQIQGPSDRPPFQGFTRTLRLFDPAGDDDHDGLSNASEILKYYTDPTKADTDGDGLPDAYEVKHPCLSPYIDEGKDRNDYGVILPGNDDTDGDGVSNLDEYKRGTDPCVKDH